jgi:hypothetical protein
MKPITFTIRAKDIRVAIGHQQHAQGCGTHKDQRRKPRSTQKVSLRKSYND